MNSQDLGDAEKQISAIVRREKILARVEREPCVVVYFSPTEGCVRSEKVNPLAAQLLSAAFAPECAVWISPVIPEILRLPLCLDLVGLDIKRLRSQPARRVRPEWTIPSAN